MSERRKTPMRSASLGPEPVSLARQVQTDDLASARALIGQGVEAAREAWVPAHQIVDALAAELVELATGYGDERITAEYLRAIANSLDQCTSHTSAH